MLRTTLLSVLALTLAAPAFAQAPRVPVPLQSAIGAGYPACSTATIMNLTARDPFVTVRAGPSARERALGRLRNGDAVFACVRHGNWFGIVFERPGRRTGCGVERAPRRWHPYRGPCRSGWVHYDYIGGYADWISP